MKPEELRIGNWVYDVGGTIESRVIKLTEGKVLLNSPIPFTIEWMIRFDVPCEMGDKVFELFTPKGDFVVHKDLVKYVHQFQNLYFALTGDDLMPLM